MKTKAFEERIRKECQNCQLGWDMHSLYGLKNIRVSNKKELAKQTKDKHNSVFKIDIDLGDEIQLVSIMQRNGELEFLYFGITPNEEDEESLDTLYEQALIMSALRQKIY